DGSRLPATYANFLYLNGTVLLPVYGQPMKDLMAVQILEAVMPGYEIIPIDCRALIRQHGSLHCTTMQLPTLTATR
ncbi:MAG: agmatine deiminase family protein, partial [Muribaculaceae bacterium]|nr:agmatine deiminase family protein [Muribaculaceae bacterium]